MEHDNDLTKQAINSYSHFSPNQKEVLNILIDMAVDGRVVANITDICAISNSTRATVSTAISFLNKYGVIENTNANGIKFTGCLIKQSKLNEIALHYNKKLNLRKR
jgi:hypothetical protein